VYKHQDGFPIMILYHSGQCGNYLASNISKFILDEKATMTKKDNNEYIHLSNVNTVWTTNVIPSHLSTFTNITHEEIAKHIIEVQKTKKLIIINNHWNIAYTEVLGNIKRLIQQNDIQMLTDNNEEWISWVKNPLIKDRSHIATLYDKFTKFIKQQDIEVFELEYELLFIDKDDNRNKYIELCDFLNEDYSNEGYNHLSKYIDANTTLMEKYNVRI
jgi:hypothetical protein